MAAARGLLLVSILIFSCFAETCFGFISFSSLQRTLIVTASHKQGLLKAGEDELTVTWGLNQSFPTGTDSEYKKMKVLLCYAPISQVDRAWRKTKDDLNKDKTCQHKIVERPYSSGKQESIEWTIKRDVPTATYFVRAYALDANNHEVAYGQNTNTAKTTNLFEVQAISGRHVSLDIASVCFSAFSIVSLFGFFFAEKRKARKSQQ